MLRVISIGLLALLFSLSFQTARATEYLGQIGGPGGSLTQLSCPTGSWMTGLQMFQLPYVFHAIRLRCTAISEDGGWRGDHRWTSTAGSSRSFDGLEATDLFCGRDAFIQSISGRSEDHITTEQPGLFASAVSTAETIGRLSIACYGPDGNRQTIANAQINRKAGATYTGWQSCPDRQGISTVRVRAGWGLDSLNFGCTPFRLPLPETAAQEYVIPGPAAISVARRHGYEFKPILARGDTLIDWGCRMVGQHFEIPPGVRCAFQGFEGTGKCLRLREGWRVKEIRMFGVYDWRRRPETTAIPRFEFEGDNRTGMVRVAMVDRLVLEGPSGPPQYWKEAFNHCSDPAYH